MILKKQRLKKRSSLTSKFSYAFLMVLVLVIIGFLLDANLKINKKRAELLSQIRYLQQEIQQLEEKKAAFESQIMRAETDEFWEERLREQGYQKSGEEVFVVLPQEEIDREEVEKEKSFWQKLLEKLKLRD